MITRRKTRQIQVGNVKVGGGAPITVQSMTNFLPPMLPGFSRRPSTPCCSAMRASL
jgi:hypothetical protein